MAIHATELMWCDFERGGVHNPCTRYLPQPNCVKKHHNNGFEIYPPQFKVPGVEFAGRVLDMAERGVH